AIVVDGEIVTAPTVNSKLPGGGIIEGGAQGFTKKEVKELIVILRAGELPATPELVSRATVTGTGMPWLVPAMAGLALGLLAVVLAVVFAVQLLKGRSQQARPAP